MIIAVVKQLEQEGSSSKADDYLSAAKQSPLALSARCALATKFTKTPIAFNWDIPRTREGFYHYKAGLPAATKRAIEFGPYADLLWLETAYPSVERAAEFAKEIHQKLPQKKLVYNLSPSFNWMGQGFNEESLRSFIWDLARHKYA